MVLFIIAFSLAVIPFFVLPGVGDGIRQPKEILSILAFISIIGTGLFTIKRPFKCKPLVLFWGWCFCTTFLCSQQFPIFLANGIAILFPSVLFAWKEMFYVTIVCLTIYVISSSDLSFPSKHRIFNGLLHFDKVKPFHIIAYTISWVVVITCIYSIIQALGLDNFFRATNNMGIVASVNTDPRLAFTHRIVACVGIPTKLAVWIAMCIPFLFYVRRNLRWSGFILVGILLALTQSATAIIVSICTVMFYLMFKSFKKFLILFMIILFIGGFTFFKVNTGEYFKLTGRIGVHKEAWEIVKQRPLLGMGLGSFEMLIGLNPAVVSKLKNESWKELHDEYGQIWFTTGLIGLGLFLWFIISIFLKAISIIFRKKDTEVLILTSSLIAFLLVCFTLFPMRLAPHSFYGVIILSLLMNKIGGE